MGFPLKFGKQVAREDLRIPFFHHFIQDVSLVPPPDTVDWSTLILMWYMLLNDTWGDCVDAGALHAILQMSTWAGAPLVPTDADALALYEANGNFNPNAGLPGANPTDQGSVLLGQGGLIEYWMQNGIGCGGAVNRITGFLQLQINNVTNWQQGIYLFGGLLTGIQVPASLMANDQPPDIWNDFSGSPVGGHCIWINGYNRASGLYKLVSWGRTYQATETFLRNTMDEAIIVVDPVEMNARGVNAAGISMAQLTTDMQALKMAA